MQWRINDCQPADAHARADVRLGRHDRPEHVPRHHCERGPSTAARGPSDEADAILILVDAFRGSPVLAEPTAREVTEAMKRDFHPRGQATMERIPQDAVQRICTETRDNPPAALAKQLEADMKTIVFP